MRPGSVRAPALVIAISSLLLAIGCENKTDDTANNLNTGASDSAGDDVAAGACDCLKADLWFRFDKLTLDTIDLAKHNVQIALNPLWKKDIDAFELNFYVHVVAATATEVSLEIINGARVAGTTDQVCLLPYTKVNVTMPRDGCALQPSAPTAMNVYAGTPANPKNCAPVNEVKHSIPVRGAVLQALLSADCARIDDGLVSAGHLPASALDVTCTCLTTGNQKAEECGVPDASFVSDNKCDGCNKKFQNLNTLLNTFGALEYKCKEGEEKAACLTASFAGGRIDAPPPVCDGF